MESLDVDTLTRLLGRVPPDKVAQIDAMVKHCLEVLGAKYNRTFETPTIVYGVKGTTAGFANYGRNEIRLNTELLYTEWDDMLNQTVPHEVAHLVAGQVYGFNIKPHGGEWTLVMLYLGLAPTRCHSYNVKPSRQHARPHTYLCDCKEHKVTNYLHNKMQRGRPYTCTTCKGRLIFKESNA